MPSYHFFKNVFFGNQDFINELLSPAKPLNAYFQGSDYADESIELQIENTHRLPIEIIKVVSKGSSLFPHKDSGILLQPNTATFKDKQKVTFKGKGALRLSKDDIAGVFSLRRT